MGIRYRYRSGDLAAPPSLAAVPLLLGTCADGVVGDSYTFDPGDDARAELGAGKATGLGLAMGQVGRCVVSPVTGTYPALPAVAQTGGGPTVTIALIDGGSGANDDAPKFKLTVTSDASRLDVSYDGTSTAETFPVPAEGPAVLRGTVNIAGSVPAASGLTLIFTDPASAALTFATSPSTPALLVEAFNTLAVAAPLDVRARIHEATTGEQYLELYSSAALGASAAITLDATSTADGTFGLGNVEVNGTPATRAFDWLGIVATFPAGPYTAGTIYSIPLFGPRGAVSDYLAALAAAVDNYTAHPFGFVAVVEDPATNANARALYDALAAAAAGYIADEDSPVLFDVMTPTALHEASATKVTNAAGITAFEASLDTALQGATISNGTIVVDDVYMAGPGPMPGLIRRPAIWGAVLQRAALDRLGGNLCDGRAILATLKGPDGTLARDDAKRPTKLSGLAGPGFACLRSMADGGTMWAPSATRAGSLDRYRSGGAVAFALEASRVIMPQLQAWIGTWETDPASPKAADPAQLADRAAVLEKLIDPIAQPPQPGAKKNVTAFSVSMSAPLVLDDGIVYVALDFNPLAVAESIRATITATGVALS